MASQTRTRNRPVAQSGGKARRKPKGRSVADTHAPEMRVTAYDRHSAFVIATVLGLALATLWLMAVWLTNRPETVDNTVELELIELSGGEEDGAPDETLKVESPEDVTDDPSLADNPSEETEIQEMVETVMELSEQASQQAQQQFRQSPTNSGKPGSATGTGRPPLGSGDGTGGMPREQRWYISLSDGVSLNEYASQLDFFGIELGLLQNNELTLVTNVSQASPTKRVLGSGKERGSWMYFTWQGGNRKKADEALFKKAGVRVTNGVIFHFYPKETERQLATLEFKHANKKPEDIRRTYFAVRRAGGGYEFTVVKQKYYR